MVREVSPTRYFYFESFGITWLEAAQVLFGLLVDLPKEVGIPPCFKVVRLVVS